MRKWMRERMTRRRKPSQENLSESTGKVGQAKDPSKPAPLVPNYDLGRDFEQPARGGSSRSDDDAEPSGSAEMAADDFAESDDADFNPDSGDSDSGDSGADSGASGSADSGRSASKPVPGARAGRGRRTRGGRGRSRSGGRGAGRSSERSGGRSSGRASERSAGRPSERSGASSSESSDERVSQRMEVETQPESPTAPPGAAGAATGKPQDKARQPRGVVVLTIGLPGSGKTTWYKRRGVTPLSSDMLRSILFDSITEQRYQGLVFSTLRSLLRARLIAKMPWNYVDATNLSPHERRQWIKMSRGFGYEVHAVYFDVPLEVCLA